MLYEQLRPARCYHGRTDTSSALQPSTSKQLSVLFESLRKERYRRKRITGKRIRCRVTAAQREEVRQKTGGLCHVCAGPLGDDWQVDHLLACSTGGLHSRENYLPACRICNKYRWDYLPEEIHYVLRLGVWAKTQIETQATMGKLIAPSFLAKEQTRIRRRRSQP